MPRSNLRIDVANAAKALRRFENRLETNVVKPAIREGLEPVLDEARRLAPVEHGQLRKALRIRNTLARQRGVVKLVVSLSRGDLGARVFYPSFVDFGTKLQKGQHFMERAFAASRDEAVRVTRAAIRRRIEREAAR